MAAIPGKIKMRISRAKKKALVEGTDPEEIEREILIEAGFPEKVKLSSKEKRKKSKPKQIVKSSHGHSHGHSHGNGHGNGHDKGHGNGHGNGHDKGHGNGHDKGHDNSHGNGHDNSHGHKDGEDQEHLPRGSSKTKNLKIGPNLTLVTNEEMIGAKVMKEPYVVKEVPSELKTVKEIHNNDLVTTIGSFLLLITFTSFVIYQTIPLYQAASWFMPEWVAIGSLSLSLMFTAYFSLRKSVLSFILCFFVLGYEVAFVSLTSEKLESVIIKEKFEKLLKTDEKIIDLKKSKDLKEKSYNSAMSRYENPEDKMHQNGWWLKTYVLPSEESSMKAQKTYYAYQETLKKSSSTGGWTLALKILYRVLLVTGCMVLMHFFITRLVELAKNIDLGKASFRKSKINWV